MRECKGKEKKTVITGICGCGSGIRSTAEAVTMKGGYNELAHAVAQIEKLPPAGVPSFVPS